MAGTPQSVLSSQIILAVLDPEENGFVEDTNLFSQLGVLRSVAQKVLESASNERPPVARPAREARELLKGVDDECLSGLF